MEKESKTIFKLRNGFSKEMPGFISPKGFMKLVFRGERHVETMKPHDVVLPALSDMKEVVFRIRKITTITEYEEI